ncbi:MAG: hypothetical protein EOO00_05570 [Chitinophagaceae bacterium]|nr:MAG: hypothetical protein EOO00_05570 [Chitinophagaceae bacterium]
MATKTEELKWHLDYLKERYEYLNLNDTQAAKVYTFESERDAPGVFVSMSELEELDCEWTVFRSILSDEQFGLFEQELDKRRESHIQSLKESDVRAAIRLAQQLERNKFLEQVFVPGLLQMRSQQRLLYYDDTSRIDYLKAQYLLLMNSHRKSMYAQHFRHHRIFQPNEFNVVRLQVDAMAIWPSCHFFEKDADEPTRMLFTQVKNRINFFAQSRSDLFESEMKRLATFEKTLSDKNLRPEDLENGIRLDFRKNTDQESALQQFMMSVLLADPAYYRPNYH